MADMDAWRQCNPNAAENADLHPRDSAAISPGPGVEDQKSRGGLNSVSGPAHPNRSDAMMLLPATLAAVLTVWAVLAVAMAACGKALKACISWIVSSNRIWQATNAPRAREQCGRVVQGSWNRP